LIFFSFFFFRFCLAILLYYVYFDAATPRDVSARYAAYHASFEVLRGKRRLPRAYEIITARDARIHFRAKISLRRAKKKREKHILRSERMPLCR